MQVWNLNNMYGGPTTLTGHDGIVLALCTQGYGYYQIFNKYSIATFVVILLLMGTKFNSLLACCVWQVLILPLSI